MIESLRHHLHLLYYAVALHVGKINHDNEHAHFRDLSIYDDGQKVKLTPACILSPCQYIQILLCISTQH